MRLSIVKSANATSLYVIKSVTVGGKRTSKIVEKLGTIKELEEKLNGRAPFEWAKEYVKALNKEEVADRVEVIAKFSNARRIPKGNQVRYNGGYLFLQSIYNELGLERICKEISNRYKFEFDLNNILANLIYTRILYPSSKRSSLEAAGKFLEQPRFEIHHIYRALEVLAKESDFIQSQIYKRGCNSVRRNTRVLYYDCTNYFFEIEQASGIKQYGVSKEHRPNPVVQMGLFMDGDGIPLAFCINPGNRNEQLTLTPLEAKITKDFELSRFVVCTDAGLGSQNNRKFNSMGERAYVTTQSLKTLKKYLRDWSLNRSGWCLPGSSQTHSLDSIDDTSKNNNIYYKSRMVKENGLEEQLVVTYSPKYKEYSRQIREAQIQRAANKIKNPSALKKKRANDPQRFIVSQHCTENGEIAEKEAFTLDHKVIENEEQYDGFYGVCTNLDAEPLEILKINKGRWEIEQAFRIMKTEFRARPVFLSRDDRILAHFLTCFISLLIYRILEQRLKPTLPDQNTCGASIIRTLRDLEFFEMQGEGYVPIYTRSDQTDALHQLFKFRTDTEIITKKDMKKIFQQTKK
jgi:transposase/predicted house-cleaning noncanonical NTP pyrophosphatase (MazG superfamily)